MRNVKRPATTTLTGVAPRRTHAARRLPGAMAVAANDNVPAQIVGQVPGYSPAVANEEGYWYSRYSMMTPTMQSGMGVTIPMDQRFMGMVQQMIASVGAAPADPVMPPLNPALLQVIYAGGDPHYVTAPNQMDFGTLRWVGGSLREINDRSHRDHDYQGAGMGEAVSPRCAFWPSGGRLVWFDPAFRRRDARDNGQDSVTGLHRRSRKL